MCTMHTFRNFFLLIALSSIFVLSPAFISFESLKDLNPIVEREGYSTHYHTIKIEGVDIFYREAGPKDAPTILLLHGYPTSSHMYRNLIRDLSDRFHLIAPDYPGFGRSEQPSMEEFDYSFDNFAHITDKLLERLGIEEFSIYMMDYGAPVGYRLATKQPEQVQALIVQNGNAYAQGLLDFWEPIQKFWKDPSAENRKPLEEFIFNGLIWQYTNGTQDSSSISPDNWIHDLQHLERPGNVDIQLALFYDYRNNIALYPAWQEYLRSHQPPTLLVWGENDYIFPAEGAYPYAKDLKNIEFHLLNTGHFALEEEGEAIALYIRAFFRKNNIR